MTPRQSDLLAFIVAERAQGRYPSYQEMAEGIGLRSKSSIFRLVEGLERSGKLTRGGKHQARSLDLPGDDYARGYRDGVAAARRTLQPVDSGDRA